MKKANSRIRKQITPNTKITATLRLLSTHRYSLIAISLGIIIAIANTTPLNQPLNSFNPIWRAIDLLANHISIWLTIAFLVARQQNSLAKSLQQAALCLFLIVITSQIGQSLLNTSQLTITTAFLFSTALWWLMFIISSTIVTAKLGQLSQKRSWPITIMGAIYLLEAIYYLWPLRLHPLTDPSPFLANLIILLLGTLLISQSIKPSEAQSLYYNHIQPKLKQSN